MSFPAIIEGAGRDGRLEVDRVKRLSQPVPGLAALPDEGLPMVDEQLDLARLPSTATGRKRMRRGSSALAVDGERDSA
jgi:hypothetical protein